MTELDFGNPPSTQKAAFDFRLDFDLDPELIYLNSGSQSICPRFVFDAVIGNQRAYERNPTAQLFGVWERLWRVQKTVAAFFGANPGDLFLRPSVTHALNDLILGMPLKAGGEILVSDLEYGAITRICRYKAENSSHSLRTFALPKSPETLQGLTPAVLLEAVLNELRPETRMLLVSEVMTGTGLILPIEEIALETRRRGVILVVDAAHSPGALPVDFQKLQDVDLYGGNLHKWMMGPKGTAFGWVAARHQRTIQPIHAGWTSYDLPPAFQAFSEGGDFAARFMLSASQDFSGLFALEETIAYWKLRGPEAIRARIGQLNHFLEAEMARELGWPCLSPESALRGPLLTYRLPDRLAEMGYGFMKMVLQDHGLQIVTPVIDGRSSLRFSPHIYNCEDELVRAVNKLAKYRGV